MLRTRWNPFELNSPDLPDPVSFFTAPFSQERLEQFILPPNREDFWSPSQRARMVWDILIRTRYDAHNPSRIGIARLLKNTAYLAAYPLHEVLPPTSLPLPIPLPKPYIITASTPLFLRVSAH